jgi:hypothetical protein
VRNKSTVLVMHSGNHEIIGIRHRKTQTLYISDLIIPHSCMPAYGRLQVGIYIAALLDAFDRAKQASEAEEANRHAIPLGGVPENSTTGEARGERKNHPGNHPPRVTGSGRGGEKKASATKASARSKTKDGAEKKVGLHFFPPPR